METAAHIQKSASHLNVRVIWKYEKGKVLLSIPVECEQGSARQDLPATFESSGCCF